MNKLSWLPKPIKWLFIPLGTYCHGRTRAQCCPWWDINPDYPEQFNGYCHYLKAGDWEIDEGKLGSIREWNYETQQWEECTPENLPPFGFSLIWEQCKECSCKQWDWADYYLNWRYKLWQKWTTFFKRFRTTR